MNQINWKNLLALVGFLLLLINFAQIKEYVQMSNPFSGLSQLPEAQRYLVILGIILVSGKIIQELRRPKS